MPKGIWKQLTEGEKKKIRREYLDKPVKRLATEIGISGARVERFLKNEGLKIPDWLVEKRKRESRFKKGHESFNKGLKQSDYMSKEAINKSKATRFKKGNVPHNTNYDGHERISKDGYIEVRVRKGVYRPKHRVVWERNNGKIPKGHIIRFINGDQLDCRIENLEMVSMERNMLENSRHRFPKEIIPSMELVSRIKNELKNNEPCQRT